MYKCYWTLLYGIYYFGVIDVALSQQSHDKSVNLALETVFEFDKDGKSDIQLLNKVQKFIGKVKNVIDKNNIERRQSGTDESQKNKFINFILDVVNVLNKFEDNDLERFFVIVNNEIRRYCDKDKDIHILSKLNLFRNIPAYVLRWYLKSITNKIEEEAYYEDEKTVIDGVNDIFKQDDTNKFDKFINNLEEYRRKTRRSLVQVIQSGLWNIFLDSYYHFQPRTKTVLRSLLHHYLDGFTSITTEHSVSKQPKTLKRAKSKTTKESRTWRQMYVEKNLDLKYPYNYGPVTKKQKRKDKTRTQKSRFMTVPTRRITKESHQLKGKKDGKIIEYDISIDTSKHTDDSDETSKSDDETTVIKVTKTIVDNLDRKHKLHESNLSKLRKETPVKLYIAGSTKRDRYKQKDDRNYYKREFHYKHSKQTPPYKTTKEYNKDEHKANTEHIHLKKLPTFYLHLDKFKATTSYTQQSFNNNTQEHERPVARPFGFSMNINHGKDWNSPQKVKKSKHYGYIQKKRKDVFSNERQMRLKKKEPEMVRKLPISLNMQLSMTNDQSTLDSGARNIKFQVENIYKKEDERSTLSEEGLSIEGFPESKRKMYNRRSDNHNDTADNHVLDLIHKLEQDLEAVKTKIHNVTVLKNNNIFDNITKSKGNEIEELKTDINIGTSVPQVINVRKFYEERNSFDVKNEHSNLNRDKNVMIGRQEFKSTDKEDQKYNSARKAINDEKWYPVPRAREASSEEVIIQRKYAPLEITPTKYNEYDFKDNLNLTNDNEDFTLNSPTISNFNIQSLANVGNSITLRNSLKDNVRNEKLVNTNVTKDSPNIKVFEKDFKENTFKDKTVDRNKSAINDIKILLKANDEKTLPKYDINFKIDVSDKNTEENVTKQNTFNESEEIKNNLTFRSHIDEMKKYDYLTLKEIITTKNNFKSISVTNYNNNTKTATTQKVTIFSLKTDTFKKNVVNEIARRYIEINNSNVTMAPKSDGLKEISTVGSTMDDGIKHSLQDKTSEMINKQSPSNVTSLMSRRKLYLLGR